MSCMGTHPLLPCPASFLLQHALKEKLKMGCDPLNPGLLRALELCSRYLGNEQPTEADFRKLKEDVRKALLRPPPPPPAVSAMSSQ